MNRRVMATAIFAIILGGFIFNNRITGFYEKREHEYRERERNTIQNTVSLGNEKIRNSSNIPHGENEENLNSNGTYPTPRQAEKRKNEKIPCPYSDDQFFGGHINRYLWNKLNEDPGKLYPVFARLVRKHGMSSVSDYVNVIGVDSRLVPKSGKGKKVAKTAFQFTRINYKTLNLTEEEIDYLCNLSIGEQAYYEDLLLTEKYKWVRPPRSGVKDFLYMRMVMFYPLSVCYDDDDAVLYSESGYYTPIKLPAYKNGKKVMEDVVINKETIKSYYNNKHNKVMDHNNDGKVTVRELKDVSLALLKKFLDEMNQY